MPSAVSSSSPAAPPEAAASLRLGGLTPLTSIDFPGRLAAVLYCQGCPWRCGYCHNPGLLDATVPPALSWVQAHAFLHRRRGLLDGVVFSGGEPTLQGALAGAIDAVRALDMQAALHTAGMYPERLAALLPRLDWVGLDIKGPTSRYDAITATPGSGARAYATLEALVSSVIGYECRTTWHAGLFDVDELFALAEDLRTRGVRRWALQECRIADAAAWTLSEAQIRALGVGFERFTLRRA